MSALEALYNAYFDGIPVQDDGPDYAKGLKALARYIDQEGFKVQLKNHEERISQIEDSPLTDTDWQADVSDNDEAIQEATDTIEEAIAMFEETWGQAEHANTERLAENLIDLARVVRNMNDDRGVLFQIVDLIEENTPTLQQFDELERIVTSKVDELETELSRLRHKVNNGSSELEDKVERLQRSTVPNEMIADLRTRLNKLEEKSETHEIAASGYEKGLNSRLQGIEDALEMLQKKLKKRTQQLGDRLCGIEDVVYPYGDERPIDERLQEIERTVENTRDDLAEVVTELTDTAGQTRDAENRAMKSQDQAKRAEQKADDTDALLGQLLKHLATNTDVDMSPFDDTVFEQLGYELDPVGPVDADQWIGEREIQDHDPLDLVEEDVKVGRRVFLLEDEGQVQAAAYEHAADSEPGCWFVVFGREEDRDAFMDDTDGRLVAVKHAPELHSDPFRAVEVSVPFFPGSSSSGVDTFRLKSAIVRAVVGRHR